ncbi:hypothetical protein GIB67_016587 [Kingdonia uniflora]|uniref:Uncharacterized protein n=1 Tax=Kingdonia uniflora TaxID=39325 RepID=A0A7J7MYZ4_9MAGN|nr:hypothetical protein GIB67_016587 [Kingdonia uniflora]
MSTTKISKASTFKIRRDREEKKCSKEKEKDDDESRDSKNAESEEIMDVGDDEEKDEDDDEEEEKDAEGSPMFETFHNKKLKLYREEYYIDTMITNILYDGNLRDRVEPGVMIYVGQLRLSMAILFNNLVLVQKDPEAGQRQINLFFHEGMSKVLSMGRETSKKLGEGSQTVKLEQRIAELEKVLTVA